MTAWASQYVGIPYADQGRGHDGVDCWGLIRLVYLEQFRTELPSFAGRYLTAADRLEVARLLKQERDPWQSVPLQDARPGDVGLFRYADGTPGHVGLMLGPRRMLHVHEGIDTTVADLHRRMHGVRWIDRLEDIGRYAP